jgi:transcriptional regulator with XRE-family HTH domain
MAKTIYREEYRQVVNRLRDAREALGLSQTEVAERLGHTQQWISQVESGSRRLDVIEFVELCLALGVKPSSALAPVVETIERVSTPVTGDRRKRLGNRRGSVT